MRTMLTLVDKNWHPFTYVLYRSNVLWYHVRHRAYVKVLMCITKREFTSWGKAFLNVRLCMLFFELLSSCINLRLICTFCGNASCNAPSRLALTRSCASMFTKYDIYIRKVGYLRKNPSFFPGCSWPQWPQWAMGIRSFFNFDLQNRGWKLLLWNRTLFLGLDRFSCIINLWIL